MSTRFFKFEDLALANIGEQDYSLSSYRAERNVDPVIDELNRLSRLPAGWDYGRGGPISSEVIEEAKKIKSIGKLLRWDMEVIPKTNGGLSLTFYQRKNDVFCVVSVGPNLNIDYEIEKGRGADFETLEENENVTKFQLQKALAKYQCSSSERYTSKNLASRGNDSTAIASLITMVGFRPSASTVRKNIQELPVLI